ncbi:MAG: ketol-acid reductoisomerase [bacterium]|nr:ketol-acid reductoisomerase [bacterium]
MEPLFFTRYPPAPGTVLEPGTVHLEPLRERTVAIIGYGTMGRAHAVNLRRSGIAVAVGVRAGSAGGGRACADGFTPLPVATAVAAADVVMLLLPDTAMAGAWAADVAPNLRPGAAIGFAHGFAVAFGQVDPGPGRPCFLAAPKAQGDMLRELHAQGLGVPGLLAVTDASPPATWDLAAAYCLAVGCLHGGGYVTTFRDECVSDQFGEQAVLCGGVIELLKAAYDTLVEAGYSPENAYFECVHELKLITDLLHRHGLADLRRRISGTAAYGGLTRGPRIVDDGVRARMREVLAEIEDGRFARELLTEGGGMERLAAAEAAGTLARAAAVMLPRLHPGGDN